MTPLLLLALGFSIPAWSQEAPAANPDETCLDLLERGERLLGTLLDEEVTLLGLSKIREAQTACFRPGVTPELRGLAWMRSTRLPGQTPSEKLAIWERALTLLQAEAPDSPLIPEALDGLVGAHFVLGHEEDALRLAFQALAERERLFGKESREYVRGLVWVGSAFKSVAALHEDRGAEHLDLAYEYETRALALAERLFGPHDSTTVAVTSSLIGTLERQRRFDEAKALFEQIEPYVDRMDLEP